MPKSSIPGHFDAKNRYILKPSTKHRPGPCGWPASHRTCFRIEKARYTWFRLRCLAFNCFWRISSQSEAIHYCPYTYHTTSQSNGLIYGYTSEVSSYFAPIYRYTYRLLLLAEMVRITADQSQINLDFTPVRMQTIVVYV